MAHQDATLDLTEARLKTLDERRKTAWIGTDIAITVGVRCARDLTIDGQVDGTIELGDNVLTVGESATIKANLVARRITISGTVVGNVTARDRVDLHATASVTGDVSAPTFSMADGSTVLGRVQTA
jgi:cytoskeletal protein CcmA (bactofilin family)